MKPSLYYLNQIKSTQKNQDAAQLAIMQNFDRLTAELHTKKSLVSVIENRFKPRTIKGIYLWGEVGRGKTFLVDCFLHSLTDIPKTRLHFHEFMRRVHRELKLHQGKINPLKVIAKKFRQEFKVLCLDEFIVSDITDAMILGELLTALFIEGIVLVTTSNIPPDELYKSGLQRERFIPAIELLKTKTEVFHLNSAEDYRLHHLTQAGVYYTPLNTESTEKMREAFDLFTHDQVIHVDNLEILGRHLDVKKHSEYIAWFDFMKLCGMQRSQNDYLVLAQEFKIIFISDIPIINANQRDLVINFIKLIDVLYDHQTKLVISAAGDPLQLYPEGPEAMPYQRTASRLIEMQSKDYFSGNLAFK